MDHEDVNQTDAGTSGKQLGKFIRDTPFAMEKLIRIEHRDKKGELVPLKLNNCQTRLHNLIERTRAFCVVKNLLLGDKDKQDRALKRLNIDKDLLFSEKVDAVYKKNVDHVMRLLWKNNHIETSDGPCRIVVTKCRRAGVSSYVEARFFLDANFNSNLSVMVMAHKGPNARRVFKYASDFYKYWPAKWDKYRKKADYKTKDGYSFENNSRYQVLTAGGRESARGDQYDLMHYSETAFYESYQEVNAALTAAPPHAMCIEESTGNGPQGGFYDRWQKGMDLDDVIKAHDDEDGDTLAKWNGYIRFFYGWLDEPAYRRNVFDWERDQLVLSLDEHEDALRLAYPDITLEQLKWRRLKIENDCQGNESGLPPEQFFEQEYPANFSEVFQSQSTKWFDQQKLRQARLRAMSVKPVSTVSLRPDQDPKTVLPGRETLRVWRKPIKGHSYCIGADVSQGLRHGDWSVAVVFDRHQGMTLEEVAFLRIKTPAPAFGELLCTLAEWYNDAFLMPEANGPGLATCTRIVENRYPHIYHRATLDLIRNRASDPNTFRFGFYVTNVTKGRILSDLQEAVREQTLVLYSGTIFDEMAAFESHDGRLAAPRGSFDDCVMSVALGLFAHNKGAPPVRRRNEGVLAEDSFDDPDVAAVWKAVMKKIARDQTDRSKARPGVRPYMKRRR